MLSLANQQETMLDDSLEFVINIENNNQQETFLKNQTEPEPECLKCLQYFGSKLTECMASLSQEDFKKSFFGMNPYARKQYLLNISISEHTELCNRFTHQEWDRYYDALSPEERIFLPTLSEQCDLIRKSCIDTEEVLRWCHSHPYNTMSIDPDSNPCGPKKFLIAQAHIYRQHKTELLNHCHNK